LFGFVVIVVVVVAVVRVFKAVNHQKGATHRLQANNQRRQPKKGVTVSG